MLQEGGETLKIGHYAKKQYGRREDIAHWVL